MMLLESHTTPLDIVFTKVRMFYRQLRYARMRDSLNECAAVLHSFFVNF